MSDDKNNKISFWKRIKKIISSKGIFSRIIVIFCLVYCVRIVEWGIHHFEETNMEAPTIITVALGLFGGELLLLCLKRIFAKNDKKTIRDIEQEIYNVSNAESNMNSMSTNISIEDESVG